MQGASTPPTGLNSQGGHQCQSDHRKFHGLSFTVFPLNEGLQGKPHAK
jgi:hypothetical protein